MGTCTYSTLAARRSGIGLTICSVGKCGDENILETFSKFTVRVSILGYILKSSWNLTVSWLSEVEIIDSLLTRSADINDLNNFRNNTDLNSRGALIVSNGFVIREAARGGDSFLTQWPRE
jgi:hypothetical protein